MNILKQEVRIGRKSFLLWSVGLIFLICGGMTEYKAMAGEYSSSMMQFMDQFPRVVLAMFGMIGVDVSKAGGYYSVLMYYVIVCAAIYAVYLGGNAVNRESIDKTYEFLFTKPVKKRTILLVKMAASLLYLIAFCLIGLITSVLAFLILGELASNECTILYYSIYVLLIELMFFMLGCVIAVFVKRAEKGGMYGNLVVLGTFLVGTIYDMLEHGGILKVFAPFKYFASSDLISGEMDALFIGISILISAVCFCLTIVRFQKREFYV